MKKYKLDYLLKFISNETYYKILDKKRGSLLQDLEDSYCDVTLNIRYLIKYGITNIDVVVYEMLEELTFSHNEFVKKINDFEYKLGHDGTIRMLENL